MNKIISLLALATSFFTLWYVLDKEDTVQVELDAPAPTPLPPNPLDAHRERVKREWEEYKQKQSGNYIQ